MTGGLTRNHHGTPCAKIHAFASPLANERDCGYDANGNMVGYWDEGGDLVAEYAYDAFGNTMSAAGSAVIRSKM